MFKIGTEPFLECSSKGDKRFSAFYARIKSQGGRTIEEIYQGSKIFEGNVTGLSIKEAKGKKPINYEDCQRIYSELWDSYFVENPHLYRYINQCSGFSDLFGSENSACQAREIFRLKQLYKKTKAVNLKITNEYDVYIGRPDKWGNEFVIGQHGTREEVLQKYKQRVLSDVNYLIDLRKELVNKTLGCYCVPLPCHGQLLGWLCNTQCYAIIGSRTFNNRKKMYDILSQYKIKWIVSGGAKGADSIGAEYATSNDFLLTEILPDWNTHGKSAGIKRNFKIIDLCDIVIAFWDGKSPGTKHAIEYGEKTNKKVVVIQHE